jgi:hypothetical protein
MVVPSERCSILKKPDSSIATTFDKYLMVPFGSSLARASSNKCLLTQRTSRAPLHAIKTHNIIARRIHRIGAEYLQKLKHLVAIYNNALTVFLSCP